MNTKAANFMKAYKKHVAYLLEKIKGVSVFFSQFDWLSRHQHINNKCFWVFLFPGICLCSSPPSPCVFLTSSIFSSEFLSSFSWLLWNLNENKVIGFAIVNAGWFTWQRHWSDEKVESYSIYCSLHPWWQASRTLFERVYGAVWAHIDFSLEGVSFCFSRPFYCLILALPFTGSSYYYTRWHDQCGWLNVRECELHNRTACPWPYDRQNALVPDTWDSQTLKALNVYLLNH